MTKNELSLQQKVVITRNGATFYLPLDRAKKVEALLLSPNKPDYIEIDDTLIAIREISMVSPASKVEELNKRKQGQWQCQHGHWHSREESVCKVNWGVITKPVEREEKELSPEARARGARVKELVAEGVPLVKALKIAAKEFELQ